MNDNSNNSFSEKHPILNLFFGLIILVTFVSIAAIVFYIFLKYCAKGWDIFVDWITTTISKLDAVIIVALITGCVSITGVVISSIVAKRVEYKRIRQTYLAQKREEPYGAFVDMIYKIQKNSKQEGSYTEEQMIDDISKFSKQITLWGSSNVVNKWVEFRENGLNPEYVQRNLLLLEDIMNEMRRDLGLKKARRGNLLAFFINDIKTVLKTTK